jgi:hypothetical protein
MTPAAATPETLAKTESVGKIVDELELPPPPLLKAAKP